MGRRGEAPGRNGHVRVQRHRGQHHPPEAPRRRGVRGAARDPSAPRARDVRRARRARRSTPRATPSSTRSSAPARRWRRPIEVQRAHGKSDVAGRASRSWCGSGCTPASRRSVTRATPASTSCARRASPPSARRPGARVGRDAGHRGRRPRRRRDAALGRRAAAQGHRSARGDLRAGDRRPRRRGRWADAARPTDEVSEAATTPGSDPRPSPFADLVQDARQQIESRVLAQLKESLGGGFPFGPEARPGRQRRAIDR